MALMAYFLIAETAKMVKGIRSTFLPSCLLLAAALLGNVRPSLALTLQIEADNDFALFSGTETTIERLLYQNDAVLGGQFSVGPITTVSPQATDTYFWLLAMDGGSAADVSGFINGVDITSVSGVEMSDDISSFLTGFNNADVSSGLYDALLDDVQAGLNATTFGSVTTGTGYTSGFTILDAFLFGENEARLFKLQASSFSPAKTPSASVPAPLPLLGAAAAMRWSRRLRQRSRASAIASSQG